jgi:hypothetical protein
MHKKMESKVLLDITLMQDSRVRLRTLMQFSQKNILLGIK